jgi:hypothetical protein
VSGRRQNKGKVFTSTDPTGGAGAWTVTDLGETFDFRAVSCSSPTLCVAAGADGELVGSTDPTGGPAAWQSLGSPAGTAAVQSIACVPALCLSGDSTGAILTSTTPLAAGGWQSRDGGEKVQISGTSCASASDCIAVDENGHLFTSTDPTGAGAAWPSIDLAPYSPEAEEFDPENGNGLFGASCPSISFCAVVGSGGRIYTGTDPFADPTLPPDEGEDDKTAPRPRRPRTTIAKFVPPTAREVLKGRGRVFLRFYADGPVRRFECRLDGRGFRKCHSPDHFVVANGMHDLRIRAVGRTGLRGPVKLVRFWTGRRCTADQCLTGGGELPSRGRAEEQRARQALPGDGDASLPASGAEA